MTNRQLLQLKRKYIIEGYKLAKKRMLKESNFLPFDEGDYVKFKDEYNMWCFGVVLVKQDVVEGEDYVSIYGDNGESYTFENKEIKRARIRRVHEGEIPEDVLEFLDSFDGEEW